MNRTQKFALNSSTTAIYQIVAMVLGFITPSLMIKTYGSEINGLVSSINQFISYISLVEAGLSGAAVYSLYKPLANNDHKGINSIVSAAKNYYIKAGYIFSSAALVLAVFYAAFKRTDFLSPVMVFVLVLLLSVNGCVDFFVLARFRVILTADQRTYVISMLSTVQIIVKAIIIIVCCTLNLDVIILYILALLPIVIKIIVLFLYTKKHYSYLDFTAEPNVEALGRRYDVIYQQVLGTVQLGAPTVLATFFLDLVTVSIYSVYNMVLNGINGVLSIFISGLPAGFGELIAKNETENLKKTTSQFEVAYYYILSVVYGLTMVLLLPFISIYTKSFDDAAHYFIPSLAFLIVANGICYSIKMPQSMLMISAGMYKEQRWRSTIQAAVIIGGGCLLAPFLGINGIIIASICSNVYRTIDLLIYVPRHITGNSIPRTARRMIMVFVDIVIIYLPRLFIKYTPSNYFAWIGFALCFAVYAVAVTTFTAFAFDRAEFKALIKRAFGMLGRSKNNG